MTELRDWKTWFDNYDDPDSPLTSRLKAVQDGIRKSLDDAPPGPIRVLSLCAGDGRDVIPIVATHHPRRDDVVARLVELDPEIAGAARDAAAEAGLEGVVEVVAGDAADLAHYTDLAPAELVLLCGIFGNISEDDIKNTVGHAATLTARGGTVIWTRHRREPNLVPTVEGWFADAGFAKLWDFAPQEHESIYVAGHRFDREPQPVRRNERLFRFIR